MTDVFLFVDATLDQCTHYVNRLEMLRLMEAAVSNDKEMLSQVTSLKADYMKSLAGLVTATENYLKTCMAQRAAPAPGNDSTETIKDTDSDGSGGSRSSTESEYFSAPESI